LMDSQVARETENIVFPEVLLGSDEEWYHCICVLSCCFHCFVFDF
jgi:hypothetical protein